MTEEKTYTLNYECSNCNHTFTHTIPFGKIYPERILCPHCGNKTAHKKEWRWGPLGINPWVYNSPRLIPCNPNPDWEPVTPWW